MSGSLNEELLALMFFSQYYFLIEGIFCPERSAKHKNLAQQFTTYSCNMAVRGYVEQSISWLLIKWQILFTVCQVYILVNQKENVVLDQASLGATDSVQSKPEKTADIL